MARTSSTTLKAPRKASSRLPYDERLADIMAAARAVIAQKGYETILMSDIAEKAGVVEGTLYRYFENKQELLVKVAEDWFAEQLGEDPELPSIRGTWNKLRHLVWRALMVVRRQPALSRFVLTEIRPNPNYRATHFFELNRRLTATIGDVFKQAIDSGEFRNDVSASLLRDMVFGCIEHRTWAYLRGEGDFSVDEVADGIANVLYRGMVAQPPQDETDIGRVVQRLEKAVAAIEHLQPKPSKPLAD